jgi:DNA polymerase III epsilon subunit-like protein
MKKNNKYLILDTETTGTNFLKHGLIQIAALALDKKLEVCDQFVTDICPPTEVEITQESLDITGFTLDRIKKGKSYLEAASLFNQFILDNFIQKPIVIAQFYPFDYAFSQVLFDHTGLDKDILDRNFIDTKTLANIINLKSNIIAGKDFFEITSLSKPGGLKDKLKIKSDKFKAHDALYDCLATREVLLKMISLLDLNIS